MGQGVIKIKYKKRADLANWLAPCLLTELRRQKRKKLPQNFVLLVIVMTTQVSVFFWLLYRIRKDRHHFGNLDLHPDPYPRQ
jgi:hypothetical protein